MEADEDEEVNGEEDDEDDDDSQGDGVGEGILGATLDRDAVARCLVDTQTKNELGLLKSEVRRLRSKVQALQQDKDDMVDNFRSTTQILINRIKELESELRPETASGRPQTAAVLDRIESRPKGQPQRGSSGQSHAPEVMRIEEEPAEASTPPGGGAADEELSVCGNCGREIPSGNLVSHNVFCYRNNYRCLACDEVIPARDKESHHQQWTDPARLLDATWRRDKVTIQSMAAHGVDFTVSHHPETKDTVLHAAASIGDVELISFFMGYGVEVEVLNAQGNSPLHLAAEAAQLSSVTLLVELGADLNVRNGIGESPLMLVCRKGNAQAARFLLEMKADAEACTKLGDTPIQLAQRMGFQDTVLALASAGAPLRPGTPSRARSGSPMEPPTRRPGSGGKERSGRLPDASPRSGAVVNGYPQGSQAGYPPLPRKPGMPPAPSPPRKTPIT